MIVSNYEYGTRASRIDCAKHVDLQVVWVHGEEGQELAQFHIPHSVAVDSYQRVCP